MIKRKNSLISVIIIPIFLMTLFILPLLFVLVKRYLSYELIPLSLVNSCIMTGGILLNIFIYRQLADNIKNYLINLIMVFTSIGFALSGFLYIVTSSPLFFLYGIEVIISYILIIFIIITSLSIFSSGLFRYQKQSEIEVKLREEMERQIYSSKINPHFLFNSLNLMVSLLDDKDKAEDVLIQLSELLRYNLDVSKKKDIPLIQELDSVSKYLFIQKERFGERLSYSVKGESKSKVPPLIIQPLVENSIKHNLDSVKKLEIEIEIQEEGKHLTILIYDSERKLKVDMIGNGTGLEVTKRRIELNRGKMEIKNGGVQICLPIR